MATDTLRVLIIDDDEVDRLSVKRCLAKEQVDCRVAEAHSLKDGMALIAGGNIDVVLLDLGLGLTTGLDSLREFLRQVPGVPVLVLSGVEDVEVAMQAIEEGAQDFIKKDGLEDRWLAIALKNAIRRHKLQQQLVNSSHELKLANEDLQQFAYIASHDLQEPLRAVSGYAQLLQKKAESRLLPDEVAYTENIVGGVLRMQQLIDDLLSYSQSGQTTKRTVDVDLNLCVSQACQNLQASIESHSATISVDTLPTVKGDSRQLIQLFQNLIGNAIKYCSPHSTPVVVISATQKDDATEVSVSDNGIGIAPQYHGRIFELFKRLHRRSEYPGTGVGLAICQRIVQRHGGTISVQSLADNGSTFTVRLPIT